MQQELDQWPHGEHYEKEPAVLYCLMLSLCVSSQRPACQSCSEYRRLLLRRLSSAKIQPHSHFKSMLVTS